MAILIGPDMQHGVMVKTNKYLKKIAKDHAWAFEELVTDTLLQQANKLISGGNNAMYRFLRQEYGSKSAVLEELSHLILIQRKRCKTLVEPYGKKR